MKKFWKLSAFALSAAFTFSAMTACGDKGETEEKSNITADQVLAIGDSITESLAGVQSFSFGLSMKSGQAMTEYTMESGMSATAIANVTEEGLDAKITLNTTEKMEVPSMPEFSSNETTSLSAYLLDGFAYMQDATDPTKMTYTKSSRPAIDSILEDMSEGMDMDLTDMLEEIMAAQGEIVLPEIPVDLIKELLTDEFTLIQKGDTTRVTLDLKKEFNDLFNYVGNLSVNTKVGDVVNYALGHIDEELTWQDITGAIKDKGGYTVSTIVNVLDNELYNASGMRLQDVKDAIFAEPTVYDALLQELGKDMADTIVNITVADLVSEYGALTVDNLVQMAAESETVTLSSMVELIEDAFTEMKIGDTFETDEDAMVFTQTIAAFKGIRADDLNANLIFTVQNDKLTKVEVSYNVKITISMDGEKMTTYVNYSMYAENFSNQAQTIALPAGANIKTYCVECGLSTGRYCKECRAYICQLCDNGLAHNG